jgi:hypothetical protein
MGALFGVSGFGLGAGFEVAPGALARACFGALARAFLGTLSRGLLDALARVFPVVVRFMFGIVDNISRVASRHDIVAVFRKGYTHAARRAASGVRLLPR